MTKKVLIIEGSATEALRTKLILERESYQVSIAADGREGLAKAAAEQPDLVVLATIMPRVSGYEIWEQLKSDDATASIPVILLTTEGGPTEMPAQQALGPNNFVAKPYKPALLVEKVNKVVEAANAPSGGGDGASQLMGRLGIGRTLVEDGRIMFVDNVAADLFQLTAQELRGKPLTDYMPEGVTLLASPDQSGEVRVQVNGSKAERWWRVSAGPAPTFSSSAMQLACLDVTEQKRALEQLQHTQAEIAQAKRDLEAAQQAKSDFLAKMSHELRTPLYEIMGMTDLALGTELDDEQREYLNKAKTSSDGLLASVTEMIEFVELSAGQLPLAEKDFDLWDVVRQVVEIKRSLAEEKGLALNLAVASPTPHEFYGDPHRLGQALTKLLDNALKFTERGQVDVNVDVRERKGKEAELHLAVRDTGCGIPADKQEMIFGAFAQADDSTTRRHGGFGLGLALAKQLAALLGGRVWLESAVDKGSTFHFTAKMACRQEEVAQAARADDGKPISLHILLAEDSPTNQLLARANLKKAGHTVEVANNGRLAVQAWANSQFDLVLMDVAMPEMDGIDATKAIRAEEQRTGKHIPILAMTAFAMNEYREKCLGAGMDGYVTKPISAEELHKAIEPIMAQVKRAAAAAAPASQPAPAPQAAAPVAPSEPPVDLSKALEMAGDDMELLQAVVEVTLSECPRLMGELREAIARADAKAVEHAAHTLKGTVSNLGSGPAREVAQTLETMGHEGNLANAAAACKQLEPLVDQFVQYYTDPAWQQAAPVLAGGAHG